MRHRLFWSLVLIVGPAAMLGDGEPKTQTGTTPPAVRGTLYIVEAKQPDDLKSRRLHVIANGRETIEPDNEAMVFARAKSGVSIDAKRYVDRPTTLTLRTPDEEISFPSPCGDATNGYALSPSGTYAVCETGDGGDFMLFAVDSSGVHDVRALPVKPASNTPFEISFIDDDTIALIQDDDKCPVPHGPCLMFEPASLIVVDRAGNVKRRGGCMNGVIVGDHAVAYLRVLDDDVAQYSQDGVTWRNGSPATFDGDDRLLTIDDDRTLRSENATVIAKNVVKATWAP